MVLAVPDGSAVDRDGDAASSARSSPQLRPLSNNGHGQGAAFVHLDAQALGCFVDRFPLPCVCFSETMLQQYDMAWSMLV